MDPIFASFDRAHEEAEALAPAFRIVLDCNADPVARAAAIAELRTASVSVDAALWTFSDSDTDRLLVARAILETVLGEPDAPDLEAAARSAVEIATSLEKHGDAIDLAERALAARPESVALTILLANAGANQGTFEPARLEALVERDMSIADRRRLHANLGVSLLAAGRTPEGLDAWRRAADGAATLMSPDVAVTAHGEPTWIQRMRQLLQLDGLGELAATWGIGGPRMVVLLEGLASAVPDAEAARLLRAEADERLRAGRDGFIDDPAWPDVTLDSLLADAADFARMHDLDELASRLTTVG
jgi:tetratricopeptide (TPR) repeat protein